MNSFTTTKGTERTNKFKKKRMLINERKFNLQYLFENSYSRSLENTKPWHGKKKQKKTKTTLGEPQMTQAATCWINYVTLKGWLTGFFLGLIVFMGCSLACVHACFFLKTHYFSHNLPLFHTSLSLLWQTPRFISWFYEAPPSENAMGWDWLAGSVCCDSLNHQYASERPAPRAACAPVEL